MNKRMVIISIIALLAISLVSAQTGPVASYGFDEGSGNTLTDSSGNSNDGAINGATWVPGRYGSALSFDGNDIVNIPYSSELGITGDVTISGWINLNNLNAFQGILTRYGAAGWNYVLSFNIGQPSLFFYSDSTSSTFGTSTQDLTAGTWYHVAVSRSGSTVNFYVNGNLAGTSTMSGSFPTSTDSLAIGAETTGSGVGNFNGLIDEIRLYDRALTQAEIQNDMNTPVTGPPLPDTTPPVRSNGQPGGALISGTTQATLSLNTNEDSTCRYSATPGIDYNSMTNTFTTTGAGSHSTTITGLNNGQIYNYYVRCIDSANNANIDDFTISFNVQNPGEGFALQFFANDYNDNDRVKISVDDPETPVDVGNEDFTLEFWINGNPADNTQGPISCNGAAESWINGNIIVDRDRNGEGRDYGISLTEGRVAFGVLSNSGGLTICGNTNVLDNQWHHVAVQRRRSDGFLWIYVDGILDGQGDGANGDVSYPDGAIGVGAENDPFLVLGAEKHNIGPQYPGFAGLFDEFRVSNVLRYTSNFIPQTQPFATDANTLGLYHFDEGSGAIAFDASGAVGGPTNGAVNVGGTPEGPQWVANTPISGNATLPVCGNLVCEGTETCSTCSQDCGVCPDTTAPAITTGTNTITFTITTNENATCRYDNVAGTDYSLMPNNFDVTGGQTHSATLTDVADGCYTYYIKCQDTAGNSNTVDLVKNI